ncbi:MAG: stage II sporulation protein P [Clostridiaceae bacterium]|nr:stage II sporulation protein P [Clostridiaceae bacterium]
MIRIRTVSKTKFISILFLIIAAFFLVFSNALLLTNKLNFYINRQLIVKEIHSSSFLEEDFLKLHINRVLPIMAVVCGTETDDMERNREMRLFTEVIMGFDIKKPSSILSSQILAMKKHEPEIIAAIGTVDESHFLYGQENEYIGDIPYEETDESSDDNTGFPIQEEGTEKPEDTIEEQERNIVKEDYDNIGGIYIKNETNYNVDIEKLLKEEVKIDLSGEGPHVLVVHTHTSEAYTPTKENNYTPSDPDRTENPRYNIVRVGEEIVKYLKEKGISVIHDKTIHDYPSYNGSYQQSLKTIQKHLNQNPSIKIVLDIHRDGLTLEDGTKLRVTSEIESKKVAQVMLVVGTDQGGLKHPNWKENLKFALKIQAKFQELYPGLARPILLSPGRYNQHATTGSLIIEVGGNGNALEEAIASSKYIAYTIAEVIEDLKR